MGEKHSRQGRKGRDPEVMTCTNGSKTVIWCQGQSWRSPSARADSRVSAGSHALQRLQLDPIDPRPPGVERRLLGVPREPIGQHT